MLDRVVLPSVLLVERVKVKVDVARRVRAARCSDGFGPRNEVERPRGGKTPLRVL